MTSQKNISCIIIDDDPAYLEIVGAMVDKFKGMELKGTFQDSSEGVSAIISMNPDVVFLDVEMPNMNGLELLESLKTSVPVILISSKKDYALEAFNFDVIDYLVKPIKYPRFVQAVNKVQRLSTDSTPVKNSDRLFVKVGNSFRNVSTEDILYIQAYGDFVKIFREADMITVHSTLKQVEDALPEGEFIKVHRSYVVRIDRITDFNQSNLVINDKVIPISHRNRKQLLDKLNTL